MKLKYIIIILHLFLYVLSYFVLVLYSKYSLGSELYDVMDDLVDVIIKMGIILSSLTFLPIIGTLMGVAKKSKEVRIGFFFATINAIIIDTWFYFWWQ